MDSVWACPAPPEGEEEPHLPEHIDKKLQLILVNHISGKETKSLSSFTERYTYPAPEAWKYFMNQTHTSKYHAERVTIEKVGQPVRTKNPAEFINFCEEIEAHLIASMQAGIEDPMKEFGDLFTRSALRAMPRGGGGDYIYKD